MTEREYQLGKRFIKRNWDNLSVERQFEIAKEIGGIRHYKIFLEMMGCMKTKISNEEKMAIVFEENEVVPLPLVEWSPIRGSGHNTVVDQYDRHRQENNIP
jgi:hypothetical protein